jgi:coenzyme PQQ precursor peptide PqqA
LANIHFDCELKLRNSGLLTSSLSGIRPVDVKPELAPGKTWAILNPLIRLWFDVQPHNAVTYSRDAAWKCGARLKEIPLAKFSFPTSLSRRAEFVRFDKESQMAWKTPKIVEVPVGMEINMYACAARK